MPLARMQQVERLPNGISATCRECLNAREREHYRKNPEIRAAATDRWLDKPGNMEKHLASTHAARERRLKARRDALIESTPRLSVGIVVELSAFGNAKVLMLDGEVVPCHVVSTEGQARRLKVNAVGMGEIVRVTTTVKVNKGRKRPSVTRAGRFMLTLPSQSEIDALQAAQLRYHAVKDGWEKDDIYLFRRTFAWLTRKTA